MRPDTLKETLPDPSSQVIAIHDRDLAEDCARAQRPDALVLKCPKATTNLHRQRGPLHETRTPQESLGHKDVNTSIVYTHAQIRSGHGVRGPMDGLLGRLIQTV